MYYQEFEISITNITKRSLKINSLFKLIFSK